MALRLKAHTAEAAMLLLNVRHRQKVQREAPQREGREAMMDGRERKRNVRMKKYRKTA